MQQEQDKEQDKVLVSLVVSPLIKDAMVDQLLTAEVVSGFSSYPINGHGTSLASLTPAEQVTGQQRQIMFQIHLAQDHVDPLLSQLTTAFSGSGIHYWVMPVQDAGHIL